MDASARRTLVPLLCAAVGLGLTLVLGLTLGLLLGRTQDLDLANIVLPIAILVTTTLAAAAVVVRDPMAPWTPIPWFLLAMAAYFGVGALLNVIGNDNTVSDAGTYYIVNRSDLFRTNILNIVSIAVVLLACYAATRLLDRGRIAAPTIGVGGQKRVTWIFAVIGVPAKFLLSIPYQVGIYHFVLPGIIGGLAGCSDLLLLILCYRAASGSARSIPWAVTFAILSLAGDVLSFSKSTVLLTGLSIVLGFYLARPVRKTLFGGVLMLVGMYLLSVPFVSFARLAVHGGAGGGAGVSERIAVTAEYLHRPGSAASDDVEQAWWTRINLANVQSFAMTLYDMGAPGHTYDSITYALVPRVLWPTKPILTPGTDFNYLASGNEHSASSPGVFAEAYWNGGWGTVLAVCCYIGAVFAWFARSARRAMGARDLRWLPCGAVGILMAFPESFFITTYVSGFVAALVYLFVMKMLVRDQAPGEKTTASGMPW